MRILYVTNGFPYPLTSGYLRHFFLIKELSKRHSITLLSIGFGGTAPVSTLARGVASAYLFKVLYEAAATPATYAVVGFLKRSEGLDAFDFKSDFNPFHVGTHS